MKLINIEGISGSGKSKIIEILKGKLVGDVVSLGGFNINQYSTDLTKFCRQLVRNRPMFHLPLISEMHLLISEMLMDIEQNIISIQNKDIIILYENYWDSILYYELAIAKIEYPCNDQLIDYINRTFDLINKYYNIPKPTYSIYIDCDIDIIHERIKKRDQIILSEKDICILKEVNNYYKINQDSKFDLTIINRGSIEDLVEELSFISKMEVFGFGEETSFSCN